jgi:Transglycosylase SLT domain
VAASNVQFGGYYDAYEPTAVQAASAYGVPLDLFNYQIGAESSWNPNALNPSGAAGIAQFIPSTAAALNVDPMDPVQSLYAAAQYDSQLYGQTGDWGSVLNRYGTTGPSASAATVAGANATLAALGLPQTAGASGGGSDPNQAILDAFKGAKGLGNPTLGYNNPNGLSWGRVLTAVAGALLLLVGLLMFPAEIAFKQAAQAVKGHATGLVKAGTKAALTAAA